VVNYKYEIRDTNRTFFVSRISYLVFRAQF